MNGWGLLVVLVLVTGAYMLGLDHGHKDHAKTIDDIYRRKGYKP